MQYTKVHIDAIGYELPPIVVTTSELEDRLTPMFEKLRVAKGQVEHMTGIQERRWWEPGYPLSSGAVAAGRKALEASHVRPEDLEVLIYGSVCRENFEPATACRVAAGLGVGGRAAVYDISNACLGAANGIVDIANRIELGQIRAGMVTVCESAREINEIMIGRMLESSAMEGFILNLATLTGGSGAAAVVVTDGSFGPDKPHKLLGGVARTAPEFHDLCIWGMESHASRGAGAGNLYDFTPFMRTDSMAVLNNGVELGVNTWKDFLEEMEWTGDDVDKIVAHQVGSSHRETVMKAIGQPIEKDFATFPFLGNIGTVSLPITAAIADEREFFQRGDRVAWLGIGSGLNCLMLGMEW